jgi:hypothetical protein
MTISSEERDFKLFDGGATELETASDCRRNVFCPNRPELFRAARPIETFDLL